MLNYTIRILALLLITSSYVHSFEGTYIAKRCTSSNCKGTGLSDLADGIIGGLFGQTPPIILVTKSYDGTEYTINFFSKNKIYPNLPINNELSFSAEAPSSGKGSIEGRFEDTGNNRWSITFRYETSTETLFYKGSITRQDTITKNKVEELNEMEDFKSQRDILSAEIKSLEENHKDQIKNLEENYKDQIKNLEEDYKVQVAKLEKIIAQPVKIDAKNLPNNVTVNSNVNLRVSPNEESKIITIINSGTKINNLIELPPSREWALVAKSDGTIGYIKSSFIINAPDTGSAPLQPSNLSNESDLIVITYPKWDSGKINKQISVNAAGFVSLKGKINSDSIERFEINGDIVNVSDNTFGHVIEVASGQNKIKVEVFENNGKTTGLEFIIRAP